MKRKWASIILAFSVSTMIIAGCGTDGNSNGKAVNSSVSTEAVSVCTESGAQAEKDSVDAVSGTSKEKKSETAEKIDSAGKTEQKQSGSKQNSTAGKNGTADAEKKNSEKTAVSDTEKTDNTGNSEKNASGNNSSGSKSKQTEADSSSGGSGSAAENQNSQSSSATDDNSSAGQESHSHKWVPQTKTVHHDAVTQQVYVVDQAAWDEPIYEEQPVYVSVESCRCKGCGTEFSSFAEFEAHSDAYMDAGDYSHGSWEVIWNQVQTGTETVQVGTTHHSEIGHYETQVLKDAYDETVTAGYVCSVCGMTR